MSTNQQRDEAEPVEALVVAAFEVELGHRGDVMGAMHAVCERLGVSLGRWVGLDGWQALLGRALAETARRHGETGLSLDALGQLQAVAGQVSRVTCERTLVAIATVLGRFIGPALGRRLIEQGLATRDAESPGGANHG